MPMPGDGDLRRIVEESWNQVAERYHGYWSPRFEPYLKRAVESFEPAAAGPLAVAGCGPGDEVLMISRKFPGRTVMALDLSSAMVAIARRRVREAGLSSVLVMEDDAGQVTGRLRQAGGIFSAFILQLLPSPLAALADWSRALRDGGRVAALFWPRESATSAFSRLHDALRKAGEIRPAWEDQALGALPELGLRLVADQRISFEMVHGSPEECWRELRESGALQVAARRLGEEKLAAIGVDWLRDHGFERQGGRWVHRPEARLWALQREGHGPEEH
jgi:ubiquinone/menaquinone biosynthesis C-methylase UbiE